MTEFRVLPGLPSFGPPAQPFPRAFQQLGSEGLVVEVRPAAAGAWVGNFRHGLSNFSGVYHHPDGHHLLFVAGGQGYVVDPTTHALESEIGAAIIGISELSNPPSLLLDHQGIVFERIGARGRIWRTRRLSWDGFRDVRIEAEAITGLGWHAPTDTWQPFEVDLRTGRTCKGVYVGPDLTEGEEVVASDDSAA